jgi:sugar lactone lactonase YvrE
MRTAFRRSASALALATVAAVVAGVQQVSASGPQVTVVADHLNNPRQMTIAGDTLYVAEAGAGGADCPQALGGQTCLGHTSAITKVSHGKATRVVTGLVSFAGADGTFAEGADSVAVSDGKFYFPMGFAVGAPIPAQYLTQLGKLMSAKKGDEATVVADISSFELAHPVDPNNVDSNPYGVAAHNDHIYVVDAAANDLTTVRGDDVSRVASFPKPAYDPANVQDTVPTSVTVGPDGALYVGELGGDGTPAGGARVWRVVPGHAPTVFAGGFNHISGIAFGPDESLYVSEISTDPAFQSPLGDVIRVRENGTRTQMGFGSLFFPGGVAVDEHGNVFVSNFSIAPANGSPNLPPFARGQVVKVNF